MPDRVIQVDLAGDLPAYQQIVNVLRTLVVSGSFQPGDQLPTVRQLAMDLGVNHNTVAEAYRLLAQEGWLDLKRGRGATILERASPPPSPEAERQFARRLNELVAKALAEGVVRTVLIEHLNALAAKLRRGGGR
jgi:GntR family transcriptional regulator